MSIKRYISISSKLSILLLLPLLTLVFFAYNTVSEKYQQLLNTQNALQYMGVASQFADVVYQLQAERGLSAGLVGSKGKVYQLALEKQRQQTDEKISLLNQYFSSPADYLTQNNLDKLSNLQSEFSRLAMIRSEVDQKKRDFFQFYSDVIRDVLNALSLLQTFNVSSEYDSLASSYIDILWLGEYAGQERGALNGVFSSLEFNAVQFSSISSYVAGQEAALRSFNNIALNRHKEQLRLIQSHPAGKFVLHSREIVFNKGLRNDALNGIQSLIGYGGLIHDFKNYVIRGDSQYTARFLEKLSAALREIDDYRHLPNMSAEELDALSSIKQTFQQYHSQLAAIAAMKKEKVAVNKIDQLVFVDDQPALDAIKFLRHSLNSQNPEYWWQQATERIRLISEVSISIIKDINRSGQQTEYQLQQLLIIYFTLTATIILASSFVGFGLRSRLVKEIKYIANTMRQSQEQRHFNQQLKVSGGDEISEMARAFNNLITERKGVEDKLLLSTQVFNETHEGILITTANSIIVDANPAFYRITGYTSEDIIGKKPNILSSGKQDPEFYAAMWDSLLDQGHWQGEIWNRKKNGELYAELLTISALKSKDNATTYYVGLFTDITLSKQQQKELEVMAHYDVLTQLPNRILLADRFTQAIAHSKRTKSLLAVCFLDLDDFKPVNDCHGHDMGDQLLIEVSKRIKSNIRSDDTVSRLGGDEFVILLGEIDKVEECEQMLERLVASLSQPYLIDQQTLKIGASIGATIYPLDDSDSDTLLRHADQVMYKAKQEGKNGFQLFNTTEDQQTIVKHNRLHEIQQALEDNEFCLFYQPKVNMNTGAVFGLEALIRWQHPEKGLLPPLSFLPVIESTELEIQIGHWVMNEALKQLELWLKQGLQLQVSINISSYHLQSDRFIAQLEGALANYPDVESGLLQLEILESSALGDIYAISNIIKASRDELGVQIALDDFGTGYSSLTHLKNLPANTIKIDQSFIRGILDDPDDFIITDGVIGLADSFNREVIAEGVETEAHGLVLQIMGCENAQGYGIARPMPASEISDWVENYQPNKRWLAYGNTDPSEKEKKILLLKLMTHYWFEQFEIKLLAEADSHLKWPEIEHNKCHNGVWIERKKHLQLFDPSWLEQLDHAHQLMHQLAFDLMQKYKSGGLVAAREGLTELRLDFDKLNKVLEQFK